MRVTCIAVLLCVAACGSSGVSPGPDADSVLNADTRQVVPSRALTELSPNLGPADGGTVLTLIGAGFTGEMRVSVGDRACGRLQVLSTAEARCVTPEASNLGAVAVEVEWPDRSGVTVRRSLADRFSYLPAVNAPSDQPDPSQVEPPNDEPPGRTPQPLPVDPDPTPPQEPEPEPPVLSRNAALVSPTHTGVTARAQTYLLTDAGAYIPGTTAVVGQAPGVEIQVGLGPESANPSVEPASYDWTPATYWGEGAVSSGTAGWDVYRGSALIPAPGTYRIATRVRFDGENEWVYVDLSGADDGFTVEELPILTAVPF
ncbi:MAG: IPT/TIG domain-containing protein [Myxococcota bacterium]